MFANLLESGTENGILKKDDWNGQQINGLKKFSLYISRQKSSKGMCENLVDF